MSDEREQARRDVQLRRFIAEEHGLNWREAEFITGSTLEELEQSAAKFAELLGKVREPERELGFFERAAIAKAERKRELQEIITGRAQQRDAYGRFLANSSEPGSFDGGARQPAPFRAPPEQEHKQTLIEAIRSGERNVGANI